MFKNATGLFSQRTGDVQISKTWRSSQQKEPPEQQEIVDLLPSNEKQHKT